VNIHGTGIVLAGTGVMLRGPSGSGKSLLALILLDDWTARGLGAMLVADDRLDLSSNDDEVMMSAPPAIAGKIELRGRGILSRPHVASARIDLVVDLVETLDRMPEDAAFSTKLLGVTLARCPVPTAGLIETAHQVVLVREAISALVQARTKTS
jgi:serine kinase of HPr protein (carbohydrate metabolism regulator)